MRQLMISGGFAIAMIAFTAVVVPLLPGPSASPGQRFRSYASLATPWFLLGVGASVAAASWLVTSFVPAAQWPVWVGVVTIGVLIGWIDAYTTWIPWLCSTLLLLLTITGFVITIYLTGTDAANPDRSSDATRMMIMAPAAGLAFWGAFWLLGKASDQALGVGDVRIMPSLALAGAATSASALLIGLSLASMAAVAVALLSMTLRHHQLTPPRRKHEIAYAPWLVVGTLTTTWLATVTPAF